MEDSYSRLYKALQVMFIFQPDFILPVKNDLFKACTQQADVVLISYPFVFVFFCFFLGGGEVKYLCGFETFAETRSFVIDSQSGCQ